MDRRSTPSRRWSRKAGRASCSMARFSALLISLAPKACTQESRPANALLRQAVALRRIGLCAHYAGTLGGDYACKDRAVEPGPAGVRRRWRQRGTGKNPRRLGGAGGAPDLELA